MYVIKLNRPEEEFFKSSTAKVVRMIELEYEKYDLENQNNNHIYEEVNSIRDFL